MLKNHINDCLLWPNDRPKAKFKQSPSDFIVHEILDWEFKGKGEHIFLYIEKTQCNTVWVSKQLAKFYGVPVRDIGYSGLKDRNAITRQYFSVRSPGIKPDSYELPEHEEYRVISHTLHDRKVKRGNHTFNDFTIRLQDVEEDNNIIDHLSYIQKHGCPNFFDSQRFGRNDNNLTQITQWINAEIEPRKREEKSILLSALRSSIFNQQLKERMTDNMWQKLLSGDTVLLDGSNSHFTADEIDETLENRTKELDVHPAGLLIGEDSIDMEIPVDKEALQELFQRENMKRGFRPLRLKVQNLSWEKIDEKTWEVKMRLPPGAYASGVIKQVFDID